MPYQGSAQSIGFRARVVADPSKRMREEAAQIKEQGEERIRGMERQASQRIGEMQRVSDIQRQNTNYELQALSKFSKTISDVLEQQAENYIEEERARGELDYMSQPPEALAQDSAEVDQAYQNSAKLHSDIGEFAAQAPNQEIETRVRRTSRYYKQGWDLAAMNEAANGFGPHLLAELQNNTTKIQDPSTGELFVLNQYEGISQWEAAANYVKQNYLKNNNPAGLSAKVRATKFLPQLNQALKTQRDQYVQGFLTQENQQMLDDEENALMLAMTNSNNPVPVGQQLEVFMKIAPRLLKNLNAPEGGYKASRQLVKKLYTTIATQDPQRARELIQVLQDTKFDHPAAKGRKGSLIELYNDEFNINELNRIASDAAYAKFKDDENETGMKITEKRRALAASFINKTPSDSTKRTLASEIMRDFGHYEQGRELAQWIQTWQPLYLSAQESEELAQTYVKTYGEITEEQAKKFEPSVYRKYKENGDIVEKAFGSASKDLLQAAEKDVTAALESSVKDFSTLGPDTPGLAFAELDAHNEMRKQAKTLLESGEVKTEAEAIRLAAQIVTNKIKEQNKPGIDPSGLQYHAGPGRVGFTYYNTSPARNEPEARQLGYIRKTQSTILSNADAVRTQLFVTDPRDLQLSGNGRPATFFHKLATLTGGRYSAYEILNFQRALTKDAAGNVLPPVELPDEAKTLDQILKERPELRSSLIRNPSPKLANRVAQQTGIVTAANVLKAIGFQESGGNYKSENWDPRTGNDKDPALGKYQILWSNVITWGPKYGLGRPSSIKEFLNNPQYQEKLAAAAMSEYIRQAVNASGGDPDIAVRKAAAFWYGGTGGFANWDSETYGAVGPYPSMRKYTLSVLKKYKGG